MISPDKIRLALHGNGFLITGYKPNASENELLRNTASQMQMTLEEALLDPEFYTNLGYDGIRSVHDLNNEFSFTGLLLDKSAKVELFKNGRKKKTFKTNDILQINTLFPSIETSTDAFELALAAPDSIFFIEKTVGTIFNSTFTVPRFDYETLSLTIDKIKYNHTDFCNLVSDIRYKGEMISKVNTDTLVISQQVITAKNFEELYQKMK